MQASCDLNHVLGNKELFKEINRQQFEIVITRYNEDLSWTDGIEHLCMVYNKGKPFSKGECKVINVPNHGIGTETILRHIIEQYHNLSNVTFFCQGTLCDRVDQPLYPLETYARCAIDDIICVKENLWELPTARFKWRVSSPDCISVNNRNLSEWRKEVFDSKLPFRGVYEYWVKGDWIAAGCETIRRRPKKFYKDLYDACEFQRGIQVEENWFLERTFHTIFTKKLDV
jgi:hypothetical protein